MATAEILARLKLNASNFTPELGKALGDAERKFGSTGTVIGRNISQGIGGGLQDAASRVPVLGNALAGLSGPALIAGAGVGAIVAVLGKGIAEAEEMAKAVRKLDAAIEATGNRTGMLRTELLGLAEDLEGKFAIDATEIIAAEATLATFRNVAGETFKEVLELSQDMSVLWGGDMASNADKLGMTLQNLGNGDVEGLKRGFKGLGTETLETIENLAKLGRTADAQAALLKALEDRIGGAGEKAGQGISGAMFRLKDAIGDATREFVTQSGIYGAVESGLDKLARKIGGVADRMKEMSSVGLGEGMLAAMLSPGATLGGAIGGSLSGDAPGSSWRFGQGRQPTPAELAAARGQIFRPGYLGELAIEHGYKVPKPPKAGGNDNEEISFLRPSGGPVTSGFGPRRRPMPGASAFHPGIDFGGKIGDPVVAPAAGVIRTGTVPGFGKVVWIDHGSGVISQLSHLSGFNAKTGDFVQAGQQVARLGNTGTSTNPHLDWRVKAGDRYVDPLTGKFKVDPGSAVAGAEKSRDAAAEKERTQREQLAERLRKEAEQLKEQLQGQTQEIENQLRVGKMRADGLEEEAEIEEAVLQLRARYSEIAGKTVDQVAKQYGISQAEAKIMVDQLATAEKLTVERVKQSQAAEAEADAAKKAEERAREWAEMEEEINKAAEKEMEEAEERRREGIQDLADFYEDAFRSGGKSIWEDFKDQGLRMVALIAAQYTMALLSGQKASLPDILGQISGQQGGFFGGGGLGQLFGAVFGGGPGSGSGSTGSGMPSGMFGDLGGWMANTTMPTGGGVGTGGEGARAGAGMAGGGSGLAALAAMAAPLLAPMATELFGLRGSNTGSTIGGMAGTAIGMAVGGPIGAAIGSAIGSLIGSITGGLFKGTKKGYTDFTTGPGGAEGFRTTGNSGEREGASRAAAGGLDQILDRIADALGGTITSGLSGSLGVRGDKFTYDPTPGEKSGRREFATQEEAVKAALADLLARGVIGGISAASQRILQRGAGDIEAAIEKALLIEEIPKLLRQRLDPLGHALDQLNERWQKTVDALKEGGASAEQMAEAQKLYNLELAEVKETTPGASQALRDFLDSLKFGSSSPYSLRDQEAASMAALKPYLDKINAGTTLSPIEQQKYLEQAQAYLDIQRQLGGSTSTFFDAIDMIQAATNKAIGTIDSAVPIRTVSDPFIEATATNTGHTNDLLGDLNGRVDRLNELLTSMLGAGGGFIGGGRRFASTGGGG